MSEQVWAVMMVRDEGDIIAFTLRHLFASGIDGIVIANNGSTDTTLDDLLDAEKEFRYADGGNKVILLSDELVAYYQSAKTTNLAHIAADCGATWIVPCDADELLYTWSGRSLADEIRACNADVIGIPLWNHYCTAQDADSPNPFERMVWRQAERNPMDKMLYRYRADLTIAQGAHRILDAQGVPLEAVGVSLGMRHFSYRSPEHFVRKAINGYAAYNATDLPEWVGAHWRQYGQLIEAHGEQAGRAWFLEHFYYPDPVAAGMRYDPAPYLGAKVLA